MIHNDLAKLESEIARAEKELSNLVQRRVALLQGELESAKERLASLGKPTSVAPGRAKSPRSVAPSPVKPAAASKEKKAPKAKPGKKRQRMNSDDIRARLIETVKSAGSEGISMKDVSDNSGVNYQTAIKIMNEMADTFQKKGELKKARWTLVR